MIEAPKLATDIIANLINVKANSYALCVGIRYGAQALLEDLIGCLKQVMETDTAYEAVTIYITKHNQLLESLNGKLLNAKAKEHLLDLMAVCEKVYLRGGIITPPVIPINELIKTLEAKV